MSTLATGSWREYVLASSSSSSSSSSLSSSTTELSLMNLRASSLPFSTPTFSILRPKLSVTAAGDFSSTGVSTTTYFSGSLCSNVRVFPDVALTMPVMFRGWDIPFQSDMSCDCCLLCLMLVTSAPLTKRLVFLGHRWVSALPCWALQGRHLTSQTIFLLTMSAWFRMAGGTSNFSIAREVGGRLGCWVEGWTRKVLPAIVTVWEKIWPTTAPALVA
mmetsp:Transcript_20424/g.38086  ORF Transcript_20424/g.38086 Transcript_20424/m.38086 type:complete len:217 (-) Transcript_20424:78-728(-)